ncbi:J domain-containing protein [Labedaea rhizosphaerae]|uniref:DnaJ-like protein n=1 Tax=Labedaea rhizosphaerae TaxID=598644 RepID=A0A4R6S975_LABRH|nr:J domain-containing protein [Labedaea rhizosphaerae]TDP96472.1 DnaJ-like protein [Labedaea rhizosphaerae]
MTTDEPVPDPYTVLGVDPAAGPEHIAAAYRRALRDCHPDRYSGTAHPDRDRLARVIAAYRQLRERTAHTGDDEPARQGHRIPVRIHTADTAHNNASPHLRAGPVRRHP